MRLGLRVRRQESEIRPEGRKTEIQSQVKGGNDRASNDAYRQAYPVDAALTDPDNWDVVYDHWKAVLPGFIYDVQYEELVSDPKRRIGDLLDHCGLPFDDACLNFHKTKRVVQTASMYQVRQPIYTTSVGSKAHYQDKLKPLNEALG